MLVEDFNSGLAQLEGVERDKDIMEALAEAGLEYMLAHLLPRCSLWYLYRSTWSMV